MQAPPYIGAIDQGTTSTRFIVFDRDGHVVSAAQLEHKQIYPKPGWVEHDPIEIWRNTCEVIARAMKQADLRPSYLAAIGLTNQRETTVVWDRKTGRPVTNAIVWQDVRVSDMARDLVRAGGLNRFRPKTGLPISPYFSALKLRWILDNVDGVRERAESGDALFGNIDAFLLWHLTGGPQGGVHLTDVTNASRTQLMNLSTLDWDPELLDIFGIPEPMLPKIYPSSAVFGESLGLKGTCIASILGDQQAALVGQTCFRAGEAKNTYGTGCFLLMNTGESPIHSERGLLTTVAYQFAGHRAQYALEGSVAISGALVQWFRDNLGLIKDSDGIEILARSVADNGDVYLVPAFSGLYAPHWDDRARGVITGLTRYTNKGHLARAALEATAFQTREVIEAMEKDSGVAMEMLRVDGGMVRNDLLMQFQADILGRSVLSSNVMETTALGAAYAAGLAVGVFKDVEELRARFASDREWVARIDTQTRERLFARWKKAVSRSLDWMEEVS